MKTFALSLCLFFDFGLPAASAQLLSENRIVGEVSKVLQWKMFWDGPQFPVSYRPGMVVDATVVSSGDEVAVFIAKLRTDVYLTIERGAVIKRAIGWMSMGSASAAVEQYLAGKKGVPGFVLRPGAPEQPPGMPIRKDSDERGAAIRETWAVYLRLPPRTPPDYVVSRKSPPELEALVAAARERISGYHDPSCSSASVTIPFFSAEDPTVYVYVDFGKGCESGVFPFGWDRTRWAAGQFSPNRPPNDWSYTVGQIRKYSLSQFSVP
jgi:hypothetical protein